MNRSQRPRPRMFTAVGAFWVCFAPAILVVCVCIVAAYFGLG